jgi:alpha-beta hydrolase superfamily lysophospholipase
LPDGDALTWTGTGGGRLVGKRYLPANHSRGVVALAHGINEYSGRYLHVISAMLDHDLAIYVVDHRGHGESEGERGLVIRFDDLVEDFVLVTSQAASEHPGRPLFVLGHSMGGLIATRYALLHQDELAGLILSGPAIVIDEKTSPLMKKLLLSLARVAPNLSLLPERKGILSRDPEVERRKKADPLANYPPTRLGVARQILLASEETQRHLGELSLPLLVMHGGDDVLTFPSGSRMLVEQAASADKALKIWLGLRHEIFNEPEGPAVIAYMIDWLEARLPR